MKAILTSKAVLYSVVEDDGDGVLLEPVDGDEDQRIWVSYADPYLIIDPTDGDIAAIEVLNRMLGMRR